MRIVVPTDFSELSKIAARYAIAFAKQTGSQIMLLHFLPQIGPTLATASTNDIKKEVADEAEAQMQHLMEDLQGDGVTLEKRFAFGTSFEDELQVFAAEHKIDLIIMGSKGASGLKKAILGSSTVAVINHCSVPIIIVPECAVIGDIEYLVYASDFKNLQPEIKQIIPYARILKAVLKIIHITQSVEPDMLKIKASLSELKMELDYDKIELEIIGGKDVVQSIEDYTEVQQAELLVMFTHSTNFLEQLFSKSFTREIAWRSTTPMLVINNR